MIDYTDLLFLMKFNALANYIQLPSNTSNIYYKKTNKVLNTKGKTNFEDLIAQAAKKYGISYKVLKSVVKAESDFNPNAVSEAGAQGLMQLMPDTAKSLGVKNPFNPIENIEGGAKYLSRLAKQFNGDIQLTLAAYNAGPGNVQKYGGIPPFQETQNYVKKIMSNLDVKA